MSAPLADLQAKGLLNQMLGTELGRTRNDNDEREHNDKSFA